MVIGTATVIMKVHFAILEFENLPLYDKVIKKEKFSEKKAAYSEYKKIKKEMRDYQIAKQNVESFYASQQTWNQEEDLKKKRQQQR